MPTAVVVATIVNTNMSEAGFRQHVVDQLRVNERSLRDRLADADGDANVVTTVLNVDEFLAYLIRRFPKAVDAAFSTGTMVEAATVAEEVEATVEDANIQMAHMDAVYMDVPNIDTANLDTANLDTAKMSEGEFLDHMLKELETGKIEPLVRFSDDWEDDIDGDIGEDVSRYPFYY